MKGIRKIYETSKLIINFKLIHKFSNLISFLVFINLLFIAGCKNLNKKQNIDFCSYSEFPCLKTNKNIALITNKGKIIIKLYLNSFKILEKNIT